jgi:hypothetical protein
LFDFEKCLIPINLTITKSSKNLTEFFRDSMLSQKVQNERVEIVVVVGKEE